jgi:predicted PurR-regulated permease PerM
VPPADDIPDGVPEARHAAGVPTARELELAISRAIARNLLVLATIAGGVLIMWFAWSVLLYAFCGVLIAVAFRGCVVWTVQKTGFGEKASYAIVLAVTIMVIVAGVYVLAPRVAEQTSQIAAQLPDAWGRIRADAQRYELGRRLMQGFSSHWNTLHGGTILSSLGGDLVDVAAGLIAAVVVGLYAAATPAFYVEGLLKLVPSKKRPRVADVAAEVGDVLKWWTLGQLVPMGVLGVATMVGLWLMHIPLAFTLGLFTGLMIFIPYAGALLAAIPVVLMGLLQGPSKMLWVILFYLGLHVAEGYAITPLVQRRAVRLPPVLTILMEALMWAVAGVLGVVVATPLAAACLVVVKRLLLREAREA